MSGAWNHLPPIFETTSIMENKNYRLNDSEMFADITDGTAIVINSLTGIYYGMNGFGTSVFENLLAGSSTADILAAASSGEGAPASLEESLDGFFASLEGFGIVLPGEPSSRPAVLDMGAAASDGFIPTCNEYKDVQELLYADPIHEVEEEKGWSPE